MKNACMPVVVENYFEPCILYLLLRKKSYGYEIQKELLKRCSCRVNVASLYRCLAKLQKGGHVKKSTEESLIGPRRTVYAITAKGEKRLASWMEGLEKEVKVINTLLIHYKKTL